MACIYMKNMKDKSQVTRAYETVKQALLDVETRLSIICLGINLNGADLG